MFLPLQRQQELWPAQEGGWCWIWARDFPPHLSANVSPNRTEHRSINTSGNWQIQPVQGHQTRQQVLPFTNKNKNSMREKARELRLTLPPGTDLQSPKDTLGVLYHCLDHKKAMISNNSSMGTIVPGKQYHFAIPNCIPASLPKCICIKNVI